jgi:hypothetical protein
MIRYSEKEQKLFEYFGFEAFLNQEPTVTYQTLALHCFSKNLDNSFVDSLRRCYNAMQKGFPYRMTQEFDDLILLPNDTMEEILKNGVRK